MKKNDEQLTENQELSEILDKLIKLREGENKPSFLKKTVYIVTGICIVLFVILICISLYLNSFTVESILSTFLAFFSIFISIFFYFKADETSTKFYDSSYAFMKDISVTLGKIEERFDEKLNSLNDKVSHLDIESKKTSKEIENKQEDKVNMINELIDRTNMDAAEKARYRRELEEKEKEIEQLREHKYRAERDAVKLRRQMKSLREERPNATYVISTNVLLELLIHKKVPYDLQSDLCEQLIKEGYIDSEGNINKGRVLRALEEKNAS